MHAEPTFAELVEQLAESTRAHQAALNELEQVMIARGLVTRESIAAARAEMAASNA